MATNVTGLRTLACRFRSKCRPRLRLVTRATGDPQDRTIWRPPSNSPGSAVSAGWSAAPPDPGGSAQALSRADVETLLSRDDIGLREKTPWRMLYKTAARAGEPLALDVGDLDLANRRAQISRKGGAIDVIVWQTSTARLLPRVIKDQETGPVFLTGRRARIPLPAADTDRATGRARLSYRRAAELFEAATRYAYGGHATLHQLRHFALTRDAGPVPPPPC
jgi:integrase